MNDRTLGNFSKLSKHMVRIEEGVKEACFQRTRFEKQKSDLLKSFATRKDLQKGMQAQEEANTSPKKPRFVSKQEAFRVKSPIAFKVSAETDAAVVNLRKVSSTGTKERNKQIAQMKVSFPFA